MGLVQSISIPGTYLSRQFSNSNLFADLQVRNDQNPDLDQNPELDDMPPPSQTDVVRLESHWNKNQEYASMHGNPEDYGISEEDLNYLGDDLAQFEELDVAEANAEINV